MSYQIRPYQSSDFEHVKTWSENHQINEEDKAYHDRLKKEKNIYVCESKSVILGVLILDDSINPNRGRTLEIHIRLKSLENRIQIYEAFYTKVDQFINEQKSNHINVSILSTQKDVIDFWEQKEFKPWFTLHYMKHNLKPIESEILSYRHYNSDDFNMYFKALGDAFFQMREAMDIRPYHVYEGASEERKTKEKEELEKEKSNIYMFYDQNEFIGSAILSNHEIDDVFVLSTYQGSGYGRRIMKSMIKIAYQQSNTPLELSVVGWNQKARNLYESLGFEMIETKLFYRKLIE